MAVETEKKVAAFFDFDGIWFLPGKSWQVKNPRLGVLGSAITWKEACFNLRKIRRKETKLEFQKYYYLPRPQWDTVELKNSSNVTPPEYLSELVRRHKNLHHDLYLISQADCPELLEFIDFPVPKNRKARTKINSFNDIPLCLQVLKESKEMPTEFYTKGKVYRILNFLRRAGEEQGNGSLTKQRPKNIYDQIFLYHTQKEYEEVLAKVLEKHQESLASKGMSLIPSYVAAVE